MNKNELYQETGNYTLCHETHDGMDISVLRTDDGMMFTIDDWQGYQPKSLSEVDDHTWYVVNPNNPSDTALWRPTIMINGLPRIIQ